MDLTRAYAPDDIDFSETEQMRQIMYIHCYENMQGSISFLGWDFSFIMCNSSYL